MDWVIETNKMSAEILRPDVNIFIDISPEVAMQRITANRATTELYETLDNLSRVRAKYKEAFEKLKTEENIYIVDGNRDAGLVADDVYQYVSGLQDLLPGQN